MEPVISTTARLLVSPTRVDPPQSAGDIVTANEYDPIKPWQDLCTVKGGIAKRDKDTILILVPRESLNTFLMSRLTRIPGHPMYLAALYKKDDSAHVGGIIYDRAVLQGHQPGERKGEMTMDALLFRVGPIRELDLIPYK
jgi:hypothetical protein